MEYKDIVKLPFILWNDEYAEKFSQENGIVHKNVVLKTSNYNVYCQAILDDLGIGRMAIGDFSFSSLNQQDFRIIPLKDSAKLYLYFIYHKDDFWNFNDFHDKKQ